MKTKNLNFHMESTRKVIYSRIQKPLVSRYLQKGIIVSLEDTSSRMISDMIYMRELYIKLTKPDRYAKLNRKTCEIFIIQNHQRLICLILSIPSSLSTTVEKFRSEQKQPKRNPRLVFGSSPTLLKPGMIHRSKRYGCW